MYCIIIMESTKVQVLGTVHAIEHLVGSESKTLVIIIFLMSQLIQGEWSKQQFY